MTAPDFSIVSKAIQSKDDLTDAMRILSWIRARESELKGQAKVAADAASEDVLSQARINVEGTEFTFDEVKQALDASMKVYTQDHPKALFVGRSFTAKLPHGEIRNHLKSGSVSLAEGVTADEVIPQLLTTGRYVNTKQTIDFASLLSDRKKDLITDEQLAEWGLEYLPGERRLTIHPSS